MTDTTADHTASYPPAPEFATAANADASLYQRAAADRDAFWAEQAGRLHWDQPWTQVLDWRDAPVAKWF
ncbi:acetyl-coenzyme A synthetase N-terminal domain-containing protein, partial [Nocardia sp. NPDC057440]|uniref:acetyl-coenzyme A synthetase N-terminal domain-containing protein n=1 Tax=Nocardia sp. NPDC057440 TaxID=3346134 RepID=UPI003670C2F3